MNTQHDVAVLDIGTSEAKVVVARVFGPKNLEVLSYGVYPTVGVARGTLVDIEATTRTVMRAVEASRLQNQSFPQRVYVGVNGECLKYFNASGTVAITGKERGITQQDVERALKVASEHNVPPDHSMLERIPCKFQVDQTLDVEDPVGKTGSVLVAEVYLAAGLRSTLADLERCVKGAGLRVAKMIPTGLATSLAVLSDEEKETGVALVDIGGGTTNVVIYYDGVVLHAETIPIGGSLVTSAIARTLTCSMDTAELLKRTYGVAQAEKVTPVETVPVKRIPPRSPVSIPRRVLAEIIEERLDRILMEVLKVFHRRELIHQLFAGVILTGGGALLSGMREKVQDYLKIETHIGVPSRLVGEKHDLRSPRFASVAGLLEFASQHEESEQRKPFRLSSLLERVGGLFSHF